MNSPDLTSPARALSQRASVETETVREFDAMADDFLGRVIDDAAAALSAPVLLAAADPFSFTNVRRHWYDVVRALARRRRDLVPSTVEQALLASSLPSDLHADVAEILSLANREGWTEYRTKRHLSRVLIPKERPGTPAKSDEHTQYKNRVRRLARTTATANVNTTRLQQMSEEGYTRKRWVTRHDPKVRHSHLAVDGSSVPVASAFTVGGYPMLFPGDPVAPLSQIANCRCAVVAEPSSLAAHGATLEGMSTSTLTETDDECVPCSGYADDLYADVLAHWAGVIGVEGEMTGDGRLIEKKALEWETPLPVRYVSRDEGAHTGAQVVGRILSIERRDDGSIWAEGTFDLDSATGREAYRQVSEELTNGISMDLDNVAFEVRVASEIGQMREEEQTLSDGRVTVQKVNPDDEVRVTTSGRLRAATIVAIPAFSSAKIHATDNDDESEDDLAAIADAVYTDDAPDDEDDESFNWVDDVGGLPRYIKRISKHLRRKGMTQGHAIATAVNVVKKMCATGDLNFPGKQSANAGSRARACKAVAEWEAKKARARATSAEAQPFADEKSELLDTLPLTQQQKDEVTAADPATVPDVLEGIASNEEDETTKERILGVARSIRALVSYRDVSETERKRLADDGAALPDGSFPIANCSDLQNAIQSVGRASDPAAARAHIKRRAAALNCDDVSLPDDWSSVVAASTPSSLDEKRPPAAWFADPRLTEPTGLTVTDDGRVYGHLAGWNTCHTSHTAKGQCVRPPRSTTNYAYFNTGEVVTDDGQRLSVGRITLGTGHADEASSPTKTMAHYENTGTVAAYVRAGEDRHGIWVAGYARPGTDLALLRATPLSGDWRRIGTSLELVAALAVNVPGFPVPRPKGMVASGQMTSLVASGMVAPVEAPPLTDSDLSYLKRLAREMADRDVAHAADLRRRVRALDLKMRVEK